MTQQAVERALGKLLTDENFREQFYASPELACWEAGVALSPVELAALSQLPNQPALPRSESAGERAVMVRGSELDVVYVQLFALGVIASVLVGFSAWKFRGQMS